MDAHDLTIVRTRKQNVSIEAPREISNPQVKTVHDNRQRFVQTGQPHGQRGICRRKRTHTIARKLLSVLLFE